MLADWPNLDVSAHSSAVHQGRCRELGSRGRPARRVAPLGPCRPNRRKVPPYSGCGQLTPVRPSRPRVLLGGRRSASVQGVLAGLTAVEPLGQIGSGCGQPTPVRHNLTRKCPARRASGAVDAVGSTEWRLCMPDIDWREPVPHLPMLRLKVASRARARGVRAGRARMNCRPALIRLTATLA